MPLRTSLFPTGRPVVLFLTGLAVLILTFVWHFLGVWASFPFGGADFHWVFHRPNGGDVRAAQVVTVVYGVVAAALAFFLHARQRKSGVGILAALIIGAGLFSSIGVLWDWDSILENLLAALVLGLLLSLVAVPLWRMRKVLPSFAKILVACVPGTWSLWEMYTLPYSNSPQFRRAVLTLVIFYPFLFATVSFAAWRRERREGFESRTDAGP